MTTTHYDVYHIEVPGTKDELVAILLDSEISGLEETTDGIRVYTENAEQAEMVSKIIAGNKLRFSVEKITNQNWNSLWESNFEAINVTGNRGNVFVHVRAAFHPPFKDSEHELIITPKMSFGTGHHQTTYLVMQLMESIDFVNKSVIDFGTGTGILAILAEKLGAAKVLGIDNDEWSMANAIENCEKNNTEKCDWVLSDHITDQPEADIILANINLNIILSHLKVLKQKLKNGGTLIISGLLLTDETIIKTALNDCDLKVVEVRSRNNWIAILCQN